MATPLRALTATCCAAAHRHRGGPVLGPAGRTLRPRRLATSCIRTTAAGPPERILFASIDVSVALRALAMNEEALRHDKMQAVLRPSHGDMEQPAFLVDVRRCSSREIGGNAAVNDIQHEHPFGRMDRREDQI